MGSPNSFGLDIGTLKDNKCFPLKKVPWPKNVWALLLPLGEPQGTIKALTRPMVEELGFTVLGPAGGRSTWTHFLWHHPWEAELRLGRHKGPPVVTQLRKQQSRLEAGGLCPGPGPGPACRSCVTLRLLCLSESPDFSPGRRVYILCKSFRSLKVGVTLLKARAVGLE